MMRNVRWMLRKLNVRVVSVLVWRWGANNGVYGLDMDFWLLARSATRALDGIRIYLRFKGLTSSAE